MTESVDDAIHADDATVDVSELSGLFAAFSSTARRRAPLYAALAEGIAHDPDLPRLLHAAPPTQRMPVLLFAAVHHLLIAEPTEELAAWYPNLSPAPRRAGDPDLMPAFRRFVEEHSAPIDELLATRVTQTNEVGRCGSLLPALRLVADEVGPIGIVDVGTSGGLNLLLDRYEYRYTAFGRPAVHVGGPSTVVVPVDVTGPFPVPPAIPPIVARCGIDLHPIDVSDDQQARWLEACVWPDQADRFHRLVAAIAIARVNPPEIVAGDAVASLAAVVERIGAAAHPVVINSWVLNYFTGPQRTAYLAELDRIGTQRDLSWVYAEAPALIPELPVGPDPKDPHRTVLSIARWRDGRRSVDHLATVHPHGFWIQWR